MPSRRAARLNEQFRREISQILRTEVRDPRVGTPTITGVEVTPDLWMARVFVRPGPQSLMESASPGAPPIPNGPGEGGPGEDGPGEDGPGENGPSGSGGSASTRESPPSSSQKAGASPGGVHVPSPSAGKELIEGLNHAAPFIRRELGKLLTLRRVPELRFQLDRSMEHASRIEEILRDVLPEDGDGEEEGVDEASEESDHLPSS